MMTGRDREFISINDWPGQPSRVLNGLFRQVFGPGYREGADPGQDALMMIFTIISTAATKRILVDPQAMIQALDDSEDLRKGSDPANLEPTPVPWPFRETIFIESEEPVPGAGPTGIRYFEGLMVFPAERNSPRRHATLFFSGDGLISNHALEYDQEAGTASLPDGAQAASPEAIQGVGTLVRSIAHHVGGPGAKLHPAPMTRAQRRQAARRDTTNRWLVVTRTVGQATP